MSDQELLAELGVTLQPQGTSSRTPSEERIIAGFRDILHFVETQGRAPLHGEDRDIFERLYAVRLERLRGSEEFRALLAPLDQHHLLDDTESPAATKDQDDAALLAELGIEDGPADVSVLRHVRPRDEVRTAEQVASRKPCVDFENFKPLFARVRADMAAGLRQTRRFERMAEIREGEFFIVGGQIAYVEAVGQEYITDYERRDSRLRVVYDNGTESHVTLRSLQRALHRDESGRRITTPDAGPLFGGEAEGQDQQSGTIYVLRSRSDHPMIASHRELIHKIGVTGADVEGRIANAAADPTYLLAEVDVVATYKLFNINRTRLEAVFHRVFASARLDLTIEDRFGRMVKPREWYLAPLSAIDEAVARVRDGSITKLAYDPSSAAFLPTSA